MFRSRVRKRQAILTSIFIFLLGFQGNYCGQFFIWNTSKFLKITHRNDLNFRTKPYQNYFYEPQKFIGTFFRILRKNYIISKLQIFQEFSFNLKPPQQHILNFTALSKIKTLSIFYDFCLDCLSQIIIRKQSMNRLADLPLQKKELIFKAYLTIFILINAGIFLGVYYSYAQEKSSAADYQKLINNYLEDYEPNEAKFEQFSFYENYNDLVLENKELNEGYREGVNKFSNLSQKQFYSLYNFIKAIAQKKDFGEVSKLVNDYYDWSRKEAVIHDEKGLEISYIFSVLTAIEYQINANQTQKFWVSLSAQEVIDCCPECLEKQRPEDVYKYIQENGVTTDQLYPYVNNIFSKAPGKCRREEFQTPRYYIQKYQKVKGCGGLQLYVSRGPVVVGLDARKFSDYQYGIFNGCERKKTHYAVLVGMSYDSWKLQNSWGRKWGERGYIRIGAGDTCGICLHSTVPILQQE